MIAFFDNGNLSILFGKISNNLNNSGIKSYILTFSKRKKEFLEKNNIENVIYFNIKEGKEENGKTIINNIENNLPDFRLYRGIEFDRILKHKKEKYAKEYLFKFTDIFTQFINKYKIKFIFGEVTWAIEYIAYFIMKYYKLNYFNPLNNYIVPGRFAFLDYKNTKSFIKKFPSSEDLESATKIYFERKNMDINKNARFLKSYIPPNLKTRLINLLQSFSHEDYRYALFLKKKILLKYVNRILINKAFNDFRNIDFLEKNKNKFRFAIFNLHIQPEATPDVVSTYYNDQYRLIEVIRASLPSEFILLVKEHPNGIGSRNINWLRKVSKIHGVELINPKIPMINLFEYIDLVFTIAGTVSYESSLYQVPSIIFSDIFLEIFPMVQKVKDFDTLPYRIQEMINIQENVNKEEIVKANIELIAKIYANTYEGNIYDPFLDPSVLDKNNIKNITEAIISFIKDNG
jgi:hypothetical protein